MKRFFYYMILFFIAIFAIDKLSGICFDYLNSHAKGGDTANQYYICKKSNENILIFGSSRANHHYIPSIIEDSLNTSCYNCGTDGNGIILHYGRYKLITERYTPQLIIYDLVTDFDIIQNDNLKYLDQLKQYYNEADLTELFNDVSPTEKYKLYSNLYQYNTKFIQMLSDNISPQQSVFKGYKPIYNTMNYEPKSANSTTEIKADSIKLKYIEKLIQDTQQKGIKLVFMISPFYNAKNTEAFEPVKKIIEKYNLTLYDFYSDEEITSNKNLFGDPSHMNDKGAQIYTKKIIPLLKHEL